MKKYTHDMPVPLPPEVLRQVGSPHLRYVSNWEQTSTALPRSLHSHPDFAEFTLILAGQGICEINGVLYPITKGDLIVCNCGILHDEFIDPKPLSLVSIAADGIQIPNLPKNHIISSNTIPLFHLDSSNTEFFSLIKILVNTVKSSSLRCGLISQSLFLALFYLLLDIVDMHHNYHHIATDTTIILVNTVKSSSLRCGLISQSLFLALFYLLLDIVDMHHNYHHIATDTTIDLVHQIRLYVDSHITQELSIANIATRFGISPSYLARIFKHAVGCPLSKYIIRRRMGEAQGLLLNSKLANIATRFGISPSYLARIFKHAVGCPLSKYIIRRRMGEAQGLLLNSKLPISEVAIRVGYPNQSYFTKLFTQSFDISPLQYRKISRTRLVNLPDT